ncbi:I78 family peptidase inhibitor [Pantoea sp. KPR_PJ]|uniref:I78 family peptidase inhibitor n=1 Tax=Pantoea sp. KPR_PJ TaxID=2738375 RepID=UPI0035298B05
MKNYGKALLALGVLVLAACQSSGKTETAAAGADAENDICGASQYQSYVGKPLSAVSSLRFDTPVRAIPWNSAVTMDFNLRRINFLADKSDTISKVYCG